MPALGLYVALLFVVLLSAQKTYNAVSENRKKYVVAVTLCIIAFLLNNTLSDLVEANKVGSLFFICLALLVNFSSDTVTLEED